MSGKAIGKYLFFVASVETLATKKQEKRDKKIPFFILK